MKQTTYDMLESSLQDELINLDEDFKDGKRGQQVERAMKIANMLNEIDKVSVNDGIETEKIEVERQKNELTWKKIGFEMCKIMCPAIASYLAFDIFQKRTIRFEETGRLVSTASRQLKMPNLLSR